MAEVTQLKRYDAPRINWGKWFLIGAGVLVSALILVVPTIYIFVQAFSKGLMPALENLANPDMLHAIWLTVLIALITVPVNLVFGTLLAWLVTRFNFPGRQLLLTLLDIPFAVSPVALVAGVACAVCVTVYNCLCPRRELRDYPVSMLQAWAFLMGAVLFELSMHPWTLGYTPSLRGVGGILFVVLFGNLLAFNLYMTGVKLIGPEKSVLYGFAEPVTAAILAVTLLDTPFTVWDALGFAAVFAMLVVLSVGGKKYAERLEV